MGDRWGEKKRWVVVGRGLNETGTHARICGHRGDFECFLFSDGSRVRLDAGVGDRVLWSFKSTSHSPGYNALLAFHVPDLGSQMKNG